MTLLAGAAERLRFEASAGTVIRVPPGAGYGSWVGGHRVTHDADSGTFVLYYRERTPLEQHRGGRCAVALSSDGIAFDDVWSASKAAFSADSLEVGHCVRHEDEWRLYISYEVAGTTTWRVDVLRALTPAELDPQFRRTALDPHDYGLEFLKGPYVAVHDGCYEVLVAGSPRRPPSSESDRLLAVPRDATLLAVSDDGLYFPSVEYVFEAPGDDSWHGRRARINGLLPWGSGWVATFAGGRTTYDNFEEWCGLAATTDRRRYARLDAPGPWVRSPHGSVRYVQLLRAGGEVFCYYEYTRADGSHDLRVTVLRDVATS